MCSETEEGHQESEALWKPPRASFKEEEENSCIKCCWQGKENEEVIIGYFDRAVSVVKWGQKPDGCVDSKDISDKELLSKI